MAHEPSAFVELDSPQPSSILFTGGTTGPPKGVVLSHSHNLNIAQSYGGLVGYTEDDVLYSVFPLFHANAKYMSLLTAMAVGATRDRPPVLREPLLGDLPPRGRDGLQRDGGDAEDSAQAARVRRGPSELGPDGDRRGPGAELVEAFEQRFDLAVLDVYGLTETGPVTAINWEHRRPGSCGVPTPWYEVRVVDDDDLDVEPGEMGQIVVRPRRTHVMMERYWHNDAATVAALRNLWFHTGDLAHQDADGFIWFHERGTDSIRRRGENVSAWEVERVLADHPGLLEAAVFGVPAEIGGQEVMVACVRRPGVDMTPEELLDYCTGKMPHFAVPRYVRFMDTLPRSHAQRVLKPELKEAGVRAPGVWDREAAGYVVKR